MIGVALLGAGMMGTTHARAYTHVAGAQVRWVYDRDLKKAQEVAAGLGARATDVLTQPLDDTNVQAADICLPTDLHRDFTERAAAAGKHVFCEKPIARHVTDGQAMVSACRRAGVKFMVGHVLRFFAEYQAARRVVKEGQIGAPAVVRATRAGAFPTWGSDNWYADFDRSGGPIVDLIIHDFDFIRWTFGEVRRVYSRSQNNYALVTLRLETGAICHVEGSWAHPSGTPFTTKLEIAGTEGLYASQNQLGIPLKIRRTIAGEFRCEPESPPPGDPYALELQHFIECIHSGAEPLVSGSEAIRSLQISLAAVESASSRQPVLTEGVVS